MNTSSLSALALLLASAAGPDAGPTPKLNPAPGPEYADAVRKFQGIPAIERAMNGRLWAAWYGGGVTEDRHNYVMVATSADGGKTWLKPKLVIDPDGDGPWRAFDPCLWHDPAGKLWLFFAQRSTRDQAHTWAFTTDDATVESPAWSVPRYVGPGIMMNKPVATASGTWLLPLAHWGKEGSSEVVASTDGGKSFASLGKATIPDPAQRNCDEHMLVERKDGSLLMWVRTKYGIGQSVSTDGGKTWPAVEPSQVAHTASRFFLRRLASGKLLIVKHGELDKKPAGRRLLTAYLSDDDGKTWTGGLVIDERPGVSYPDAVEAPDGTIYLIYDFERIGSKQILMATFTEADVRTGLWQSKAAQQRVVINQATGERTK